MKVLVTGGAGFIGSHLVEALVSLGFDVAVLDDFSTGRIENLLSVLDRVEVIKGDIVDSHDVSSAVKGKDVVIHLAAKISSAESVEKPELYKKINYYGTKILLSAMARNDVKKLVFMSSSAVYGEPKYVPIDEDHPKAPSSPYGQSKLMAEREIRAFTNRNNMKAIVIRLFNAYGPRQEGNPYSGVINQFISKIIADKPPIIYGDGLQTRDFIYVLDVVGALVHMVQVLIDERHEGRMMIFNLGSGVETRIIDLARLILDMLGKPYLQPIHLPPRPGDVRRSVASIEKIKSYGWSPRYSLREGIYETISYYRNRPGPGND